MVTLFVLCFIFIMEVAFSAYRSTKAGYEFHQKFLKKIKCPVLNCAIVSPVVLASYTSIFNPLGRYQLRNLPRVSISFYFIFLDQEIWVAKELSMRWKDDQHGK